MRKYGRRFRFWWHDVTTRLGLGLKALWLELHRQHLPIDYREEVAKSLYQSIGRGKLGAGLRDGDFDVGTFYFTGWKFSPQMDGAVGQIVFWPPEGTPREEQRYFYVNLPGTCTFTMIDGKPVLESAYFPGGEYKKGECFDISGGMVRLRDWKATDVEAMLEQIFKAGLTRLIEIVVDAKPEWIVKGLTTRR